MRTGQSESCSILLPLLVEHIVGVAMLTPRLDHGPPVGVAIRGHHASTTINCQVVSPSCVGILQMTLDIPAVMVDS